MRVISKATLVVVVILSIGLLGPFGCGSDAEQARKPSGPSMSAVAEDTTAEEASNNAPTIESVVLVPAEPTAGEPVSAVVKTEDADRDNVTLSYTWLLDGTRMKESGSQVALPDARKGSLLELVVVASDGKAMSSPEEHRVRIGNQPPRIDSLAFQPKGQIRAGRKLVAEPSATDADGDIIDYTYEWYVNDELAEAEGPEFSTVDMKHGDTIEVRVVASDGESMSKEFSSTAIELVNAAPQITREPVQSSDPSAFVYTVPATDADGDRLRFRLLDGPEGMEVDRTSGAIAWYPTGQQGGKHTVAIEVDDLHGGVVMHRFSVDVGVEEMAAGTPRSAEPAPAAPAPE